MPIIIYVCAIGAFAVNNRMIDIYYMIIFGIVGYLFKKLDYPMAPMVLALVLGNHGRVSRETSPHHGSRQPHDLLQTSDCSTVNVDRPLPFHLAHDLQVEKEVRR